MEPVAGVGGNGDVFLQVVFAGIAASVLASSNVELDGVARSCSTVVSGAAGSGRPTPAAPDRPIGHRIREWPRSQNKFCAGKHAAKPGGRCASSSCGSMQGD